MFIVAGVIAAIFLAILLYELTSRLSTKIFQTILITPNFLSWVVVAYMAYAILHPMHGTLNQLIAKFGMAPVDWYEMALEEMAKRAQAKGVNLILCSPLHRATLKYDTTTKMFADRTETVAKKYGLVYINAFETLNKQYNNFRRSYWKWRADKIIGG